MRWFLFGLLGSAILFLVLVAPLSITAQEPTYLEMRAEVVRLYEADRFQEAADLLRDARERFPGRLMANSVNLALMEVRLGRPAGALDAVTYGLDHGIWYGKYTFLDPVWEPLRALEEWKDLEARNEEAWYQASAEVEPRLEVSLPKGFDPERSYPLFLALHGGGENVDVFMPEWTSPGLRREFIVAYPQSSQLVAMDGFNWTEDMAVTRDELRTVYEDLLDRYPIDESLVVIGGFSSGGVASLEAVMKEVVPAVGFVVLCPAMPEDFSSELVSRAARRGVRGTLLTTEMDGRVDQQRAMSDIMKEMGLVHQFHITPDIGHWYPDDLADRIDGAVRHILQGG